MKTKHLFFSVISIILLAGLFSCGGTDMLEKIKNDTMGPGFTVKYNGNNSESGSVPVDAGRYSEGASVILRHNDGNLARDGYMFNGWALSAENQETTYVPNQAYTMGTSDITFYAVWIESTETTYTINYASNSVTVYTDNTAYTAGQTAYLSGQAGLSNGTNIFLGWANRTTGKNYAPGSEYTITASDAVSNIISFDARWGTDLNSLPVMIDDSFDGGISSLYKVSGATASDGIVSIMSNGSISTGNFRIPAIIECTATLSSAADATTNNLQNLLAVKRINQQYNANNLPSEFSFIAAQSSNIITNVSLITGEGLVSSSTFATASGKTGSYTFRIVLNNSWQEFYIDGVLQGGRRYNTLQSTEWWSFSIEGHENSAPLLLESIKINAIQTDL